MQNCRKNAQSLYNNNIIKSSLFFTQINLIKTFNIGICEKWHGNENRTTLKTEKKIKTTLT